MLDLKNPNYSNFPTAETRPGYMYQTAMAQPAPVVTVISPVGGADIQATQASLDGQSFRLWEWVLIPEAGTLDKPVLSQSMRQSRGKYVLFLPVGVLLEPTAIEQCVWFLESHPDYDYVEPAQVSYGENAQVGAKVLTPPGLMHNCVLIRKSSLNGNRVFWRDEFSGAVLPEHLVWHTNDILTEQASVAEETGESYDRRPDLDGVEELPRDERPFMNPLVKKKRRFLLVAPWLTMGGVDKFNLDLIEQLDKRDWEVTIVTTVQHGCHMWQHRFANITPDIFRLSSFLSTKDYPRFVRYLIQSRQIDVAMVTLAEFGYLLLPYLRAYCPNTVFVDYCHALATDWINFPGHSVLAQKCLDLAITSSEDLKQYMVSTTANPKDIEVAYTNVNTSKWAPNPEIREQVRKEYNIADDEVLVLYACRFVGQKQPDVFVKTIKGLRDQGLKVRALAAGHGGGEFEMRELISEYQLEPNLEIVGAVSNQRIYELMCASDIYFLPSIYEGISLAVYEAMSVGLTVVGANVGGQRELVTPDCGILICREKDNPDENQYIPLMAELLRNPERIASMGKAARERVKANFELDQMGERMIELFELAKVRRENTPEKEVIESVGFMQGAQAVRYARLSREIDLQGEQSDHIKKKLLERSSCLKDGSNIDKKTLQELVELKEAFEQTEQEIETLISSQEKIWSELLATRYGLPGQS